MSYNFVGDSFHAKKLCSRLSSIEVPFDSEIVHFAFLSRHLGDYGQHTMIILGSCESA